MRAADAPDGVCSHGDAKSPPCGDDDPTAALPFAFVFIAGVFSDLLETGCRSLVFGVLAGVILAHAMYGLAGLLRIG